MAAIVRRNRPGTTAPVRRRCERLHTHARARAHVLARSPLTGWVGGVGTWG
jgi:hypothetical protein